MLGVGAPLLPQLSALEDAAGPSETETRRSLPGSGSRPQRCEMVARRQAARAHHTGATDQLAQPGHSPNS